MQKKIQNKQCLLLYADTDHNADMFYFAGLSVPDPFIALKIGNKKIGVFNALEYARALKESNFDKVFSLEDLLEKAKQFFKNSQAGTPEVIAYLCKALKMNHVKVPYQFPTALSFELQRLQLTVEAHDCHVFFQEREIKTEKQARAIQASNKACAAGFFVAESILKISKIKNDYLYFNGEKLTPEHLRTAIEVACLESGAIAMNTIVAGGKEACDPHCRGLQPLRANELIVIDIFPRSKSTGYYGDMTRTFLKGKASEAQKKLVVTVREAQKKAIAKVKAGVPCNVIHEIVQHYFEKNGFKTQKKGDHYEGFFHSTGHGLGLEVHEAPRVNSRTATPLVAGNVITIEPGLYYPDIGGCRIEDIVWVKKEGCSLLSDYHYRWHISE